MATRRPPSSATGSLRRCSGGPGSRSSSTTGPCSRCSSSWAPAATLLDRVPDAIAAVLPRHGVSDAFLAAERDVRNQRGVSTEGAAAEIGVVPSRWQSETEPRRCRLGPLPLVPGARGDGSSAGTTHPGGTPRSRCSAPSTPREPTTLPLLRHDHHNEPVR